MLRPDHRSHLAGFDVVASRGDDLNSVSKNPSFDVTVPELMNFRTQAHSIASADRSQSDDALVIDTTH